MIFCRKSRLVTACIAIISMLFAQLALAAYACPDLNIAQRGAQIMERVDAGTSPMPGCDGMDMAQPNLCHAAMQAGKQSLDKPELPRVLPWLPNGFVVTLPLQVVALPRADVRADAVPLTRSTAPPLSIRNCCFRI